MIGPDPEQLAEDFWRTGEALIIRAAVLDVIDRQYWELYEQRSRFDEDYVNQQRLNFADAVLTRIRELSAMFPSE